VTVAHETDLQRAYWNDRFAKYQHTGWKIPGIYEYDQKIRIHAVLGSLQKLRIPVGPDTHLLDIGCGTGDLAAALVARGASVVGYDISSGAIESARARMPEDADVVFDCVNLVDAEVEHGPFDVITSITVLQHIMDDQALDVLIKRLSGALKPGGTVLILETVLPDDAAGRDADHYTRPRTRSEWLQAFERAGLRLELERSYPQNAVSTLGRVRRTLRGLRARKRRESTDGRVRPDTTEPDTATSTSATAESVDGSGTHAPQARRAISGRLRLAAIKTFLTVFKPLDHWLRLPTPLALSGTRILAFQRENEPES